ncbi:MAG TPA: hypothetical protein VJ596_03120, partial [Gemmatimonadaceae bacterium]|nr:hypothetical protein [Gemmatimonadaceae bacterium]
TGIGLANVRERLVMLYGDRYQLTTEVTPDEHYMVTMRIPFVVSEPAVAMPVPELEPARS